jgi:hypothetical protein
MKTKNIEILMQNYIENFEKLEKITKEQQKQDKKIIEIENEQTNNFYNLKNKTINNNDYLKIYNELQDKHKKEKAKKEILLIEKKLLQDNENIINDKIIIDIFKNIILKYEDKNIGESTLAKIDNEIKEYIKTIYNKKYIYIYGYNEYRNTQPNQFIHIYNSDYSFNNYDKKLNISLSSNHNERNDYKQYIYIKDKQFLLYEYSKLEEKTEDNNKNIERIEKTNIIENTRAKAKEIYQAHEKKRKTLEKLKQEEEKAKNQFDNLIKNNQNVYLHNLYNYFNR